MKKNIKEQPASFDSDANYIFRIQDDGASDMTLQGWGRSARLGSEKIRSIKDVLKKGAAKIATSVPSPFARMHLFDTAFKMVMEDLDGDTVYHQLVSDCMDMFQLLFKAGNEDPNIRFSTWNRQERINALRNMGDGHPHKLLADTLDMFFTGRFADTQHITLIYYRNILVGGTSPLTVFFTSPNWQREMQENNIVLASTANGDVFFDMDYYPLHRRDPLFIKYMYQFYLANRSYLNASCEGLAGYIRNVIERYHRELAQKTNDEWASLINNPQQLEQEYERISVKPNTNNYLQIGPVYAYTAKKGNIAEMIQSESDFLVQPTVSYYLDEKDTVTGEQTKYKPLVLARMMNIAGTYTYGNTPWSADVDIRRSNIMDTFGNPVPLCQRQLPGDANIKYPFITTEDFLEDTLIRMPFRLNRQKFFTGSDGAFNYLLPIKKEYFNFFTKEDLARQLKIIYGGQSVTVQLQIPVRNTKGNTSILLSREYELDKTPVMELPSGMAITPFYRIADAEENLQDLNEYTILYAEDLQGEGADLSFWRYEDIATRKKLPVTRPEARTSNRSGNSYYYKVGAAFDLIELRVKDERQRVYTGLIIPEFKRVVNRQSSRQYTFAIDFGTSNTHIAYLEDRNDRKPKTFEIGVDEIQAVALYEPGSEGTPAERYASGLGEFKELLSFINREFVPQLIGKSSGSEVYFPGRTVTAEKRTFAAEQPSIFHNINCGFYLDADEASGDKRPVYQTNLKWLFENSRDRHDPDRIEAFLKELMLLIRNKVIMNNGSVSETQIVWLVPLSMKQRSVDLFAAKWQKAFDEVFKRSGAKLLPPITESVAPYFFLKNNSEANVRDFADAVNIDIGGGTTDVMFFMRRSNRYMSTSFRFAGDDLWGSGFGRNEKDNGFIRHFQSYNKDNKQAPDKADKILENFLNDPNLTAADVVSLLFRYDDHFSFSQSVNRDCPQLKIVLFLHYAAIVYHMVQLLQQQELGIPRYFTFTGKGSQYLTLMCARDRLTAFTRMLLQAYTDMPVPADFNVVLTANPKEATANGATLFVNSMEADRINKDAIDIITHWGNDGALVPDFKRNITTVSDVLRNDSFHCSVLNNLEQFITKTLNNEQVATFLAGYEIRQLADYVRYLTGGNAVAGGELHDSFFTLLESTRMYDTDAISETYFFFPLKDALYQLSKHIIDKQVK